MHVTILSITRLTSIVEKNVVMGTSLEAKDIDQKKWFEIVDDPWTKALCQLSDKGAFLV